MTRHTTPEDVATMQAEIAFLRRELANIKSDAWIERALSCDGLLAGLHPEYRDVAKRTFVETARAMEAQR